MSGFVSECVSDQMSGFMSELIGQVECWFKCQIAFNRHAVLKDGANDYEHGQIWTNMDKYEQLMDEYLSIIRHG